MDRVQQGLAVTIYADFLRDGTGEDPNPDSATVEIRRVSDGTVVYSGDAIDVDDPAGRFGYTLTPDDTALLDTLTADWTVTFDSIVQTARTTVEVVGGFLFTLAQARALEPLNDTDDYPTAAILQARTLAEQTIEDACGRAFVPRYRTETHHGTGTAELMLNMPDIRAIRSVTTTTAGTGTAYTSGELALLAVNPTGLLYNSSGAFTAGVSNITVGYEHGLAIPPMRVSQAALLLARSWLVKGPVDDRALGQATAGGDFSFGLATPGRNGSWTGLPEVDATIDFYSLRVGVA